MTAPAHQPRCSGWLGRGGGCSGVTPTGFLEEQVCVWGCVCMCVHAGVSRALGRLRFSA